MCFNLFRTHFKYEQNYLLLLNRISIQTNKQITYVVTFIWCTLDLVESRTKHQAETILRVLKPL